MLRMMLLVCMAYSSNLLAGDFPTCGKHKQELAVVDVSWVTALHLKYQIGYVVAKGLVCVGFHASNSHAIHRVAYRDDQEIVEKIFPIRVLKDPQILLEYEDSHYFYFFKKNQAYVKLQLFDENSGSNTSIFRLIFLRNLFGDDKSDYRYIDVAVSPSADNGTISVVSQKKTIEYLDFTLSSFGGEILSYTLRHSNNPSDTIRIETVNADRYVH